MSSYGTSKPAQPDTAQAKSADALSADDSAQLLRDAVRWQDDFIGATLTARTLCEKDQDFYDGIHWTEEEKQTLRDRHQPIVTNNHIARKINFLLGYEISTRVDFNCLPRSESHEDAARAATDVIRYVCDEQKFNRHRSEMAKALLVPGYAGILVDTEVVATRDGQDVEIVLRDIPYDRCWFDPRSRRNDFSDARYTGFITWMDLDEAYELYPDATEAIGSAYATAQSAADTLDDTPRGWADTKTRRVKVSEVYFKRGGKHWSAQYTKSQTGLWLAEPQPVKYVDDRGRSVCPFILRSAFSDRNGNRYGVTRAFISAQEEINKRRSKSLHLMNVRQIIYEEGAVSSPDEAQEQLAKPDGAVRVNEGALAESRIIISQTQDMAQGHFQLLQEAKEEIEAVGPSAPLATVDAGTSGRAVLARQRLAAMELQPVFDVLRDFASEVGHQIWYRIRQFWTAQKYLRVTDNADDKGYRFVAINRQTTVGHRVMDLIEKGVAPDQAVKMTAEQTNHPELIDALSSAEQQAMAQAQAVMQQGVQIAPDAVAKVALGNLIKHPAMSTPWTENSIDQIDVDIVLDEIPDTAVIEQEEFNELVGLAERGIPIPPEALIQASQLRSKKQILAILERAPSPLQQHAMETKVRQGDADLELTQAQAEKAQAEATAQQMAAGPEAALATSKAALHAADAAHKTVPDITP